MSEKVKAILVMIFFLVLGYMLSVFVEEVTMESVVFQFLMFNYLYALILNMKEK
ncbi:hypothetical protein [Pseudoalteromonas luteoviolacea]|uniref:Uncharacterized protein n=1 Tax=Pseudoalteromonas luteoviolacea NCIMB 1942 TaxID=1365253 RepID=A0A167FVW9_9GAMM|nr:hypothetical protein [Pseudoalteromonas luteoviolacea]KZN53054.1 hypothetical protein N482_25035 [Pseudoalteromonas luteoviolacea NCIMB 1942]